MGTWYFPGVNRAVADVNVAWYYTWQPHPAQIQRPRAVEFVPMIWSEAFVKATDLESAKSGSVLLGFNEPDRADQANMTVEEALNLWPQLMATGLRLGSPAPADDPSLPQSWLERFINGARERGYRVDFLAVHWYGDEFVVEEAVNRLNNFLQAVYHKFKLPIWLTEYSLIRWTDPPVYPSWEQQTAFAAKSVEMLERLPFVERYAWYSLPPWWTNDNSETTALYYQNGEPTPVGIAYRRAGLKGRFRCPVSKESGNEPRTSLKRATYSDFAQAKPAEILI